MDTEITREIDEVLKFNMCNAIAEPDLVALATIAVVTEVLPGQCFINEGEPAHSFLNITTGTAKLFKLLPGGRQQIIGFAGPGHFLGFAVSDAYSFSAEAIDPMCYCRFPRAKLRDLLPDFSQLETRLMEIATNDYVAALEQMLLLGRKPARERLVSFLLAQSRQGMPSNHSRERFILPMRRDIADYLGLTVETISRTFSTLRAEGLINYTSRSKLAVCDPVALEGLAGGLR